jgi:outer membrane protein TolC
MNGQLSVVCGVLLGLGLPACASPEEHAMQANAEVLPMLADYEQAVLGDRESRVLLPEPAAEEDAPAAPAGADTPAPDAAPGAAPGAGPAGDPGAEPVEVRHVDMRSALATAFESGREYLDRREGLYLAGLDLSLVRYRFGPVLDGTVAMLWSDGEEQVASTSLAAGVGMSRVLPTGGTFSVATGLGVTAFGDTPEAGEDDPLWDGNLGFGLSMPLLRGAGHAISHEALTQAERDLVYAVRDFELFREDFSIDIADGFLDLVSRQQRLDNLRQNYEDARFDANKAEALRLVDRNRDEDVFLARRVLIDAESDLLQAQADYEVSVDSFKIRLGLPAEVAVEIGEERPVYRPLALDADSAVTVAIANRLDLKTAAERVQDVDRSVDIARNGLLPDMNLDLGLDLGGDGGSPGDALPDTWTATAGMALELPLDRQAERNAYRASLISRDRARRDYELLLDNVDRDVRDQLRQLKRTEQQIELQRDQIEQERRAVAVTRIRYEAGDVDNRDLIDARQSLVTAQNALVDLLADHFVGRLRLMRNLGILFIAPDGMWRE